MPAETQTAPPAPSSPPSAATVVGFAEIESRYQESLSTEFITADERHDIADKGTPLYIVGARIDDTQYGEQILYRVGINNPTPQDDDKRVIAFRVNNPRMLMFNAMAPTLRERKPVGPVYLALIDRGRGSNPYWTFQGEPAAKTGTARVTSTDDIPF